MKRIFLFCMSLFFLSSMLVFTGCKDDEDKMSESDIIGRWSLYELEEKLKSGDEWYSSTKLVDLETFLDYYEIEFRKNGEVVYFKPQKNGDEVIFYGTYSIEDGKIIIGLKWSNHTSGAYPFKIINGNVLTLEYDYDNMVLIEHFKRIK